MFKDKAMTNTYDELEAEIEILKAELRVKTDSLKKLKKSHDEQVGQMPEVVSKVEKENENVDNQEIKDIECLSSNKECLEIEISSKVSKELGETDDMFKNLEEENMKVGEQLKWKKEWELEKSTLLDEISSLQSKLEFHVTISQDLQHQLHMCKQALAYEKSQQKHPEIEVSDLKLQFDDVSSEYQNTKLQLDSLNSQQGKDIEAKYSSENLELENHDLRKSLREHKEARSSSHSLSILRSNLRGLEKTHIECLSIFKARHAEWSFQIEQLTGTINRYQRELETKAATIEDNKMELECSHSLTFQLMLLNEEMSVILQVLKQGTSNDKHREMVGESTRSQKKIDLEEKLKEVSDALDKANIELNEKAYERSEMEFEMQKWKSNVQRLKKELEENIAMRKALENSLLAQGDFIESLNQEKDSLEEELGVRETKASVLAIGETDVSSKAVEGRYLKIIEEKENILEEFQKEVLRLEQKSSRRESEKAVIAIIWRDET